MLLSKQIADLAVELCGEAAERKYVKALIPQVAQDQLFWAVVLEMVEIILHRHDFVIVERRFVNRSEITEPRAAHESG
jgi:hypothetical protein